MLFRLLLITVPSRFKPPRGCLGSGTGGGAPRPVVVGASEFWLATSSWTNDGAAAGAAVVVAVAAEGAAGAEGGALGEVSGLLT